MSVIQISAETREKALQEALEALGLPEEALEIEWGEEEEDLLAGARPHVQINVRVRPEYVEEKVRHSLTALLDKMKIPHEIQALSRDDMTLLNIKSEHPDVLIGHRGETLDALQHLVARMAKVSGRDIPLVLVDAGNYRLRHIQRLKRVCHDLSQLILKNGGEEHFDPMNAIDRKIVHTLLKEVKGVKSFSHGEDINRHVIIAPAS
jgi:spoIIIJ-associated protein